MTGTTRDGIPLTTHQEFPEPDGYNNRPGYVKSNPLNNDSYVEKCMAAYPEWAEVISATHKKLTDLVPGYNISQIKEKFFTLRFYVSAPEGTDEETRKLMWEAALEAEKKAGPIYPDWHPEHRKNNV